MEANRWALRPSTGQMLGALLSVRFHSFLRRGVHELVDSLFHRTELFARFCHSEHWRWCYCFAVFVLVDGTAPASVGGRR